MSAWRTQGAAGAGAAPQMSPREPPARTRGARPPPSSPSPRALAPGRTTEIRSWETRNLLLEVQHYRTNRMKILGVS